MDRYDPAAKQNNFLFLTQTTSVLAVDISNGMMIAKDEPKKFAITHLQKKARFGFLLMSHEKWWHLCFHIWYTFEYQKARPESIDANGRGVGEEWIPGSERVLYWRVGWSRWDAGDCKYVGGATIIIGRLKIEIPFGTWYGPGLHWD